MEKFEFPEYLKIRNCKRLDDVEIEKVIKITLIKGEGNHDDPYRLVYQYWDLNGVFLFEIDLSNETSLQQSYKKKASY